ncbi:MAG: FKBP-type peptidyl-prolyl cis-trans isomerase [Coriobacteriales bacterium]|nr:FKBP-type peptidyl-prolyl cis-trans isomerase [Coriobacteriales bacterium]
MSEKVEIGSVVSILYKGGVVGEEPMDDRSSGDPLTVMIGNMQLPRGIEEALVGMEIGEEKQLEIPFEKGYGPYQEKLASWYPRPMIKNGYKYKVNDVLFHIHPEDGHRQPAFITDATDDELKIDFNHPFAGKDLSYWVKVVNIIK